MTKRAKVIIPIVVTVIIISIISAMLLLRSKEAAKLYITDNAGNTLAVLSDETKYENDGYKAYVDAVLPEAAKIVADIKKIDVSDAENVLKTKGYSIQTVFDRQTFEACENAYVLSVLEDVPFAAAVTDMEGKLLCAYSQSAQNEYVNYAIKNTAPYSALKPLSVYAPAIENNIFSWSTMLEDSPIKKVQSENGILVDWPANADGKYTNKNVSLCDGIKLSLNTIAVRALLNLGVDQSMQFLRSNFDIDLTREENVISIVGEDEVLANFALGYLYEGVSPIDMAGYYQIFANGGKYIKPYTVEKITDSKGRVIYEHISGEAKQVISEETAYIMNTLLQNTLSVGGTAEKAKYEDVLIGGKTGTGSDYVGNWFVGFTPEYSCAVWHGEDRAHHNTCAEIFSTLVSNLNIDKHKTFPENSNVKQIPFCADSGKKLTMNCEKMGMGYYKSSFVLEKCDAHTSK